MSYPFDLQIEYASHSFQGGRELEYRDMFDGRAYTIADSMEFWWERLLYQPPTLIVAVNSWAGAFTAQKINGQWQRNAVEIHVGISEAPDYVLDALIVHEIAHYRWKRHTRGFWNYVYHALDTRHVDGYTAHKDCTDWLEENGWMRRSRNGRLKAIRRSVIELEWYRAFVESLWREEKHETT